MLNDSFSDELAAHVPGAIGVDASQEQVFQQFAELLPQIAWIGSSDGRLEYANRQWYGYCVPRIAGEAREEHGARNAILSAGWRSILHPEDLPHIHHLLAPLAVRQRMETEARLRNAAGDYRWFLCQTQRLEDSPMEGHRWLWICTDIHRAKTAHENLRKAKDELETINHARDEFLSAISHELRTPLNAILGWTQLLQMNMLELAEVKQAIDCIEQNAKAQAQLVEDMLDVTRAVNNKLRINPHTVDARMPVQAAVETIRPMADGEGVRLQADLPEAPVWVHADEGRLQQIVWNLLSNAVKFTEAGGLVKLKMEISAEHVNILVTDTGRGIAPDMLTRIFERFVQAEGHSTRRQIGLGLGLSIVRHLVELHGGSVHAVSQGLGCGATFTVSLPLHTPRETALQQQLSPPATLTPGALQGIRVLVVDDEAFSRQLVATTLRKVGAQTRTAGSVAEAHGVIRDFLPNVIVCDIGMPEEDGYDFITQLRAAAYPSLAQIPAIALTGYASMDDRTRALAAGFNQHVPKPVSSPELVRAVAALARPVSL